eukprot:3735641-Prymnesium_polylepis.1
MACGKKTLSSRTVIKAPGPRHGSSLACNGHYVTKLGAAKRARIFCAAPALTSRTMYASSPAQGQGAAGSS